MGNGDRDGGRHDPLPGLVRRVGGGDERSVAGVELADGSRYRVFFYDPTRLRQDLEATQDRRPYRAEPGTIVLPTVTVAAIRQAVERLVEDGFFEHLRPLPTGRQAVE